MSRGGTSRRSAETGTPRQNKRTPPEEFCIEKLLRGKPCICRGATAGCFFAYCTGSDAPPMLSIMRRMSSALRESGSIPT